MATPLTRTSQLALLPTGRTWASIEAPTTLGDTRATNNYAAQWKAFVRAAQELGWSPDDVTAHGTRALAEALADAGLRHWSPATITRYAKLARYAGVDPTTHPAPQTAELGEIDHNELWRPRLHPISQRNALAAVIAWHWPIELPQLLGLQDDQIRPTPSGGLVIATAEETRTIPAGGETAQLWNQSRHRWRATRSVFVTTHPARTGAPPGSKLSIRGFQASFARHAVLCGTPALTWRRYRALAVRGHRASL